MFNCVTHYIAVLSVTSTCFLKNSHSFSTLINLVQPFLSLQKAVTYSELLNNLYLGSVWDFCQVNLVHVIEIKPTSVWTNSLKQMLAWETAPDAMRHDVSHYLVIDWSDGLRVKVRLQIVKLWSIIAENGSKVVTIIDSKDIKSLIIWPTCDKLVPYFSQRLILYLSDDWSES